MCIRDRPSRAGFSLRARGPPGPRSSSSWTRRRAWNGACSSCWWLRRTCGSCGLARPEARCSRAGVWWGGACLPRRAWRGAARH
eukprot:3904133-Alexandrium_andersonii.AAC.1